MSEELIAVVVMGVILGPFVVMLWVACVALILEIWRRGIRDR